MSKKGASLNSIVTSIVTHLLAGAVTLLVGYLLYKYQTRVQYLDYTIYKTESLLRKPNNIDSLSIQINGKKIKDISELDIEVLNDTDNSLNNITTVIEFERPVEIITQTILDENLSKDLIDTASLPASNKFRLGFIAKQLTKKTNSRVLTIKVLIKGPSIPDVRLYSLQGILYKEISRDESKAGLTATLPIDPILFLLVNIMLILVVIIVVAIFFVKERNLIREALYELYVVQKYQERGEKESQPKENQE